MLRAQKVYLFRLPAWFALEMAKDKGYYCTVLRPFRTYCTTGTVVLYRDSMGERGGRVRTWGVRSKAR